MLLCDAAAPPGFTEIRYHVEIESPARPSDVERIVDHADRLSPVLDVLTRANTVRAHASRSQRAGRPDMEAKVQRWVQRHGWDRAVELLRALLAASSCGRRTSASWRAADLRPGQHVIDVACGTGMVTLPGGGRGRPWRSRAGHRPGPEDGRRHDERARLAGLANVEVRRCDAEQLDATGPFDVALCSLGLMYVPSPPAAMSEMHRVLRPGGAAVVSVWGERRSCGWAELFPIVDARVSSDVCPMFFALGDRRLPRRPPRARRLHRRRADPAERRSRLRRRGRRARRGVPRRTGRPRLLPVRRRHQGLGARRLPGVDRRPTADGAGYRVPGEFVIASGRRP